MALFALVRDYPNNIHPLDRPSNYSISIGAAANKALVLSIREHGGNLVAMAIPLKMPNSLGRLHESARFLHTDPEAVDGLGIRACDDHRQ